MAERMRPAEMLAYFFEAMDHPDADSMMTYRDKLSGEDKYEFMIFTAVFQANMQRHRDEMFPNTDDDADDVEFEPSADTSDSSKTQQQIDEIDRMIRAAVDALKARRNKGGSK